MPSMAEAQTLEEDSTRKAWTAHCPACGTPVQLTGRTARDCPSCGNKVGATDLPTAVARGRRPESDPSDSLVGAALGTWQLVRLIGRGGMGRVYEAVEIVKGRAKRRRVALKVLDEGLAADPAFVRRFRREAKVVAGLSHPHVVRVLEQGQAAGRLFFAMEYVRGENLRRRLERGRLSPKEASRITEQVASALAYAHGEGIVHRDLKPENVLLDERGNVHLADFGLSRLVSGAAFDQTTRLTRTDMIMGTYEYMAPEQRRGDRDIGVRADLFSLGVILYEMLTGTLPHGRFAPPSEISKKIPPHFDAVINRALAPVPAKRFASADEMRRSMHAAGAFVAATVEPADGVAAAYRPTLRHLDLIAAFDKAAGIVLVLCAFGLRWLIDVVALDGGRQLPAAGFLLLFFGGIWMWNLGKRVARVEKTAREAQIFSSVFLLLVPPLFTALGIYGLIVMLSDRTRHAFDIGRKGLEAGVTMPSAPKREPTPSVAALLPVRAKSAHLLMRVFHFGAMIWSLYAGFLAIELFTSGGRRASDILNVEYSLIPHAQEMATATLLGAALAFALGLYLFTIRKQRRGVGLAVIAFIALAIAGLALVFGLAEARSQAHLFESINLDWDVLPRHASVHSLPEMPPLLEISR